MRQSNFWKITGIGNLFMVGISGTSLDQNTLSLIKDFGISKFILFSRNTKKGPKTLKQLCKDLKEACRQEGLTPLIAIDQEGGPVRRLTPPLYPDMPSPQEVITSNQPEIEMERLAQLSVAILKPFEIDINLAPVLDLCLEGEKHVLEGRCFGSDPEKVSTLGAIYIEQIERLGIMATAKHFPGIGRVQLDPHHHLPIVSANEEELFREMRPFRRAIEVGISCIMTSHVIFEGIDPEQPATFSKQIATDLLRNDLGFAGVLMSDDLEMKGALTHEEIGQAALRALMAGHDMLLVCNSHEKILDALAGLKQAFLTGHLPMWRIDEAILRIKGLKLRQNYI